jgi:hypothetical protein
MALIVIGIAIPPCLHHFGTREANLRHKGAFHTDENLQRSFGEPASGLSKGKYRWTAAAVYTQKERGRNASAEKSTP